jgi:hypothetical protein
MPVGTRFSGRAWRRVPRPLGLIALALVLLGVAWSMSSPAFSVPDESSHYLRAMEIADGELLGPKAKYPAVGIPAAEYAFASHDTRAVYVRAGLSPGNMGCANGKPDLHGCIEVTPTGDYYPVAYLLPAVALKLANNANTALWWSRILSLAPCLALIIAGLIALWDADVWSIAGALAALTPMVLFVCSILNPSGLEIAANFAFVASALRVTRRPVRAPRFAWGLFAISGALTLISYQSGPVSAIACLAIALGLLGADGARAFFAANRRRLIHLDWLFVVALVAWVLYSKGSGVAHTQISLTPFWDSLNQGLGALNAVWDDAVGTFGSLTVPLPSLARWLWWIGIAALVITALIVGNRRDRLVVGTTVLLVLLYPILFFAWAYRLSGYGLQGRQILPILMLIPLVSGEIVHRRLVRHRLPRSVRAIASVGLAGIAVFQVYAWWYDGRVSAGAPGTTRFWAHAQWVPPLGWAPWVVLAGLGGFALVAAGACAFRTSSTAGLRMSAETIA